MENLFLILAGFQVDMPQLDNKIYSSALLFSSKVQSVKLLTQRNELNPICEVVRTKVIDEFYGELAFIEQQTIERLAGKSISSSEFLILSCDVLYLATNKWEPILDFTINCLKTEYLEDVLNSNLGNPDLNSLGNDFLLASDEYLKHQIFTALTQVSSINELLTNEKISNCAQILQDLHLGMQKIQQNAVLDNEILHEMFAIYEQADTLFKRLKSPFTSNELNEVLLNLQKLVVNASKRNNKQLYSQLNAIRNIVFFGKIDLETDLRHEIERFQEQQQVNLVYFTNENIMEITEYGEFVNSKQWEIMMMISRYMLQIFEKIKHLKLGSGTDKHTLRIYLQNTWGEWQAAVDSMFEDVFGKIDLNYDLRQVLDSAIEGLVNKLRLNQSAYRSKLKRLTSNEK